MKHPAPQAIALSIALLGAPLAMADAPAKASHAAPKAAAPVQLIELNSASKAQLKTLPGITDAYAEQIIKNRPYFSKANIVTHHSVPESLYPALHKRICVRPPAR